MVSCNLSVSEPRPNGRRRSFAQPRYELFHLIGQWRIGYRIGAPQHYCELDLNSIDFSISLALLHGLKNQLVRSPVPSTGFSSAQQKAPLKRGSLFKLHPNME
jgi:hypothetical protein